MLARLERIEGLERRLRAELEALALEAERWARVERSAAASTAAARLRAALDLPR